MGRKLTNRRTPGTGRSKPPARSAPRASATGEPAAVQTAAQAVKVERAKAESLEQRRNRAGKIIAGLKPAYPDSTCALLHRNAFELLVATILSAQSTDETVNKVTPELFKAYPTPRKLAAAEPTEIERIIHRTGFFRQKAKSLISASQSIVDSFGGSVPETMEELQQLRGVARKTANVVLGTWYGKNEGVVVDTHVGRLSHRLALTWTSRDEKDAVRIEQDLMQIIPREEWTWFSHTLIWHGRRVCNARKPRCGDCVVNRLCPSAFTFDVAAPAAGPDH